MSLADLAAAADYSPFHLHRVFGALAGVPLMSYVRNRRLDESVVDLLNDRGSVLDLAIRYGFGFEQSFTRAFSRRFGTTPARFRRSPKAVRIAAPLAVQEPRGGGILAEPAFLVCPQRVLVGRSSQVALDRDRIEGLANGAARAFMQTDAPRIQACLSRQVYFGYVKPVHPMTGFATYVPSLEVRPDAPLPSGLQRYVIPARRFAVFRYVGWHAPEALNFAKLSALLDSIFLDWLPHAAWRLDPAFHLESVDLSRCSPDFTEAQIHIPGAPIGKPIGRC
nr:helix-turn-helix domain-containing protein [Niveibacterium umoris]